MSASKSVGRVRGLAAALGIGAALLTGCGIAAADPGSPDAASADTASPSNGTATTSTDTAASAAPAVGRAKTGPAAARRTARVSAPSAASRAPRTAAPALTVPAAASRNKTNPAAALRQTRATARIDRIAAAATTSTADSAPATVDIAQAAGATAKASTDDTVVARVRAAAARLSSAAAATPTPASAPRPGAAAVPALASILHSSPGLPAGDPGTTASVGLLAVTAMIQFAVVTAVAALTPAPPSPATASPTLNLKGFDLVPSSTQEITSFYGRWTYLPGAPSLVQGRQQFDVVDPKTTEKLGTFDALVSRGTGIDYTTLLVTANDGTNVGTEAGQVPPVGSIVSHFQLGQIGLSYSAVPSPTGDLVSFTISTPLRDFALTVPLNAAKGIADRTVDNRPVELGNGYSIAPADPAGETFTAISGILPLFTTVQGHQIFNVYDSAGKAVGSFDGVFTTTSDIIGTYTQAILVTANDGTNVGTDAGQVPPVGSVYNVIYRESDDHFFLYSSLPSPSGDQVSVIEVDKGTVTNSAVTLINASKPPAAGPLATANGYSFVPVSELVPSGINGLPPRDVQIQGYQQFDVYDPAGIRIGSVDADVSSQWDAFGIHSRALLVTRVTEGNAGTGPADIPPVGSVFNFVTSGDSGYGALHSVVPSPSGDLTSFQFLTPERDIPMPSTNSPAADRTKVTFYTPFQTV